MFERELRWRRRIVRQYAGGEFLDQYAGGEFLDQYADG
ncbi:MAG: hypothetical protein ACI8XM_000826 [Haloarculaceae archaeon]